MVGQKYVGNTRGSPRWLGDFGGRDVFVAAPAKLVPTAFPDAAAIAVTLTAGAIATATSLTVTALAFPASPVATAISSTALIPAGALISFGTGKYAKTTAAAIVGATTISVEALPAALDSGDIGYYNPSGQKLIPSGTYVGRTYAERDAGTGYGPAAVSDDQKHLLAFDVVDADNHPDRDVVLVKRDKSIVIKENYLPMYAGVTNVGIMTATLAPGTDAGTFRVRNNNTGVTSAELAWNISAANLQTALRTLTGDTGLTVGLVGEVYTITFTTTVTPPNLEIVNDTTNDGGVAEGGVVLATTSTSGKQLLDDVRAGWTCVKGVD